MPRAPKHCGHHGCPDLVIGRRYCRTHEAQRQRIMAQRRGTNVQRGYDWNHRRLRNQWAPTVATGTVTCWRCQQLIHPTQPWDLGHDDNDRSKYRGPEHANRCNRRAAGRTPRV